MPPMEPLVHLHLQLSAASPQSPSLPSKSDRFQSALTEKAFKAAALSARTLNVLSLLMAYQAELCEDFGQTQDLATWVEIPVITSLCLWWSGGGAAECVHSLPQMREMGRARSSTLGVKDDHTGCSSPLFLRDLLV